jgi:murein DD-endopeptidase MepM/ murein hydrolase activator NlpD
VRAGVFSLALLAAFVATPLLPPSPEPASAEVIPAASAPEPADLPAVVPSAGERDVVKMMLESREEARKAASRAAARQGATIAQEMQLQEQVQAEAAQARATKVRAVRYMAELPDLTARATKKMRAEAERAEQERIAAEKARKAKEEAERRAAVEAAAASTAPAQGPVTMVAPAAPAPQQAAAAAGPVSGRFVRPVAGPVISGFGTRLHPITGEHRLHAGLDFSAAHGSPLYAVTDATVIFAADTGSSPGKKVELLLGNGDVVKYYHLSAIHVSVGQHVAAGDVVGLVGTTGLSTGPHLHFQVHPGGGDPIDPRSWLAARGIS